jgi:hypothetical protein
MFKRWAGWNTEKAGSVSWTKPVAKRGGNPCLSRSLYGPVFTSPAGVAACSPPWYGYVRSRGIDLVKGPALGVNSAIQESGSVDLGSGEGQNLYRASSSPCWPVRGLNLLRSGLDFRGQMGPENGSPLISLIPVRLTQGLKTARECNGLSPG